MSTVALPAAAVGVEDEAARIMALEQHHPRRRTTVGVGGGERHRVGVVGLAKAGLGKPLIEQGMRIDGIRLLEKSGGKSGDYLAEGHVPKDSVTKSSASKG